MDSKRKKDLMDGIARKLIYNTLAAAQTLVHDFWCEPGAFEHHNDCDVLKRMLGEYLPKRAAPRG